MANRPHTPTACVNEHIRVTYRNTKKATSAKYEAVLININGILRDNGLELNPRRIGEDDIRFLLEYWGDKAISTRNWYLHILNRYLKFYDNTVVEDMEINLGYDDRPNVDWLSDEECIRLMQAPKTPLEDIVIHLELCMGLRNVEVCRLMLNDIHNTGTKPYINVRGKGRGDGKYRSVRFHYMTKDVLARWMEERRDIVDTVRAYNPHWVDPGNLILWCHYKNKPQAGAYGEHTGALDEMVIEPLRERLGFHFANHTLRRTFGRRLFHAEVPVETISKFLGHESTTETLKYIGVNLDDMDAGMAKLAQYDRKKAV